MSWYVAKALEGLLAEINASAPARSKASDGSIGDADHSSRESDHNPCDCHDAVCARDFTHDPEHGFDAHMFADWLRSRCDSGAEGRVKYIISNRRIASPTEDWTWRTYTGSNPHDKHTHVSVEHPSSVFNNTASWGWESEDDMPLTDDDIRRIWQWNEFAQNVAGQPNKTNPQTILTRLNPGPQGISAMVAKWVWEHVTTYMTGSGGNAKTLDLLRWTHKEASDAADQTRGGSDD